ncbi:DNA helicase [Arthrobacter phage Shoya]|uniref:DNA helicase n=1 Tax=Arthrobacter phage Shoya TaxID=2704035 RepID=A0A6G6XI02_9CAUD|nr:DNA helicase [Arthrobacter phage Shoya]QIG57732.1 DNA helicase [Arthrobacter phage Shoya]
MNLTETNAFLAWVTQHDGRVSNAPSAVEIWQASLNNATPAEAKQAILEHYRGNEDTPASPAGIRKRTLTIRTTAEAQTRAITATAPVKHPNSWRSRNPEEWDRLTEQGKQDRRAELAARGLL